MALSGATSPTVIISSTTNQSAAYTGSWTIGSGEVLVLFVGGWAGTSANSDSSTWTISLGGVTLPTANGNSFASAIATGISMWVLDNASATYGTGSQTLSVAMNGGTMRTMAAWGYRITGHDTGSIIAANGGAPSWSADVTQRTFTRTTARNGNALISGTLVKGLTSDEFTVAGSGTLGVRASTGGSSTSDIGYAGTHEVVATAGSTTHTVNWTTANRAALLWVEINVSTGGTDALTSANMAVGQPTVGSPALSQNHVLSPADTAVGQPTVGSPALSQNHMLSPADTAVGQPTVGSPALSQNHVLSPADTAVGQPTVGSPALSHNHVLSPANMAVGQPTVGNPGLLISSFAAKDDPVIFVPAEPDKRIAVAADVSSYIRVPGETNDLVIRPDFRVSAVPAIEP